MTGEMLQSELKRIGYAAVVFLAAVNAAVFSQQGIVAESSVDRSQILIGDIVTYSVTATYDPSLEVEMPSPGVNLGQFEVRSYDVPPAQKKDGKIVETASFKISTFETGEFEIPPVTIAYRSKGDSAWAGIRTQPLTVQVQSLNPDEAGDIRDIKPPLTPPFNWRAAAMWIAGGLMAAGIIAAAIYVIRRRRQGLSILPRSIKPPRPAHEIALAELDALVASELLPNGQVKEYYSRLADIMRRYLDNRYSIYALEMTTLQILEVMRAEALPDAAVALMRELLTLCDFVKFAQYMPSNEEGRHAVESAYRFVNDTKLVIVEEGEATTKTEAEPQGVEAPVEEVPGV